MTVLHNPRCPLCADDGPHNIDEMMAHELDAKASELWEQEARRVLGDAEFERLYPQPAIRKEQR